MKTELQKKANTKYSRSDKGKAAQRKYRQTSAGKAKDKRYRLSEKGKIVEKKLVAKRLNTTQILLDNIKKKCSCAICGYSEYTEALDFHHVNSQNKKYQIKASALWKKDFIDELQKCMCLCANCHRHITRIEREKN